MPIDPVTGTAIVVGAWIAKKIYDASKDEEEEPSEYEDPEETIQQ